MEQQRQRSATRRLAWACAIILFAVIGGVEVLRILSKEPAAEPVVAITPPAAPPSLPPPAPASPVAVTPPPTPAPTAAVTPAPPVPEPPAREEIVELQPTEADLLAAEPELLLTGMDSQRDAAIQRDRALLLRTVTGKAWDAYRSLLGKSLKKALAGVGQRASANRYDPVWNEPVLYQALLRWKTLGGFPEAEIARLVTDGYTSPMFIWLLNNSKAMEELLLTQDVNDDGGKVLRFLMDAWSMNEKSFAEILKEGGVCGDQAYFCVNTARAQGIPAMVISGETNSGGHAWAGLKIKSGEWTTGVGRIGGASKGQAHNPQTGTAITEQEIQAWNDRAHQSELVTLTVWRHLWLADYQSATGNATGHAAAVRLANQFGHSFTATWKALYALLERETEMTGEPPEPNNLQEWRDFAAAMRREFRDNPRMAELAGAAEDRYVFPYGEADDARSALRFQRRKIDREAGEQKDLIATSLKREADLILKQGGPDAKRNIGNLYDRALRDYGGSITGFKMMAADYFDFFKDDPELARKAARDVELAFKRVVETGSKDWFRANTESSIYQMICAYYRAAGDATRANTLEKRYELLLRRAKRSAL